jgi:hypothetical protein
MRTTLYEKVFIDGFHKPSYVVASIALERMPTKAELERALLATIESHPRLRSLVRTRLGVPIALEPRSPREWLERGGLTFDDAPDVRALEERLLSTPLDLRRTMPLEVHVRRAPPAIVIRIHHAVIDASSGFAVMDDFARCLAGLGPSSRSRARRPRAITPIRRARQWLARANLRPRLPGVSVVTRYTPRTGLEEEPVVYVERVLASAHARIVRLARRHGASLSELVASALLSGMHAYNAGRSSEPPDEIGLMFARARPRLAHRDAAFRADTCVVSMPRSLLSSPHHPATLAELRRRANEATHNDLALGSLYASRKLLGRSRAPREQHGLHFTLSDLSSFGRGLARARAGLPITGVRVLASPTSFDHAGMIVSRFGEDLRLSVIAHRGALDADALLSATVRHLEEG